MLSKVVEQLRLLRYRMFGREPSLAEWEERLGRIVAETVAESLRWIPPGGAFVDVGANVGVYAEKVLAERPGARAWLFEPVRAHYERCRERMAARPSVVVENLALDDETGARTIWKLKHNPGGNTLNRELAMRWTDRGDGAQEHKRATAGRPPGRKGTMHFRPEDIRCAVFDEYAREHGITAIDFVKSDTEGSDHRVLRGMLPFLERCEPRPVILAEFWSEAIFPDFAGQMQVLEALYRLGYGRIDLSGVEFAGDFLLVPPGRTPIEPARGPNDPGTGSRDGAGGSPDARRTGSGPARTKVP